MGKPSDIPQDAWDYAAHVEFVWRGLTVDTERIERHARRIMADRQARSPTGNSARSPTEVNIYRD